MKLPKKIGEILYSLYGPNGADQVFHYGPTREMAAYRELERHGLVKIIETNRAGIFKVTRVCMGKTLCETFATEKGDE